MMKTETPIRGIAKIAEFDDLVGYRTICECTSENHSVDTWIEVDTITGHELSILFHVNTYSHPFSTGFLQRLKNAFNVLIGVDQRQQEIILTKQQALNWAKVVQTTVTKLDKKVKNEKE